MKKILQILLGLILILILAYLAFVQVSDKIKDDLLLETQKLNAVQVVTKKEVIVPSTQTVVTKETVKVKMIVKPIIEEKRAVLEPLVTEDTVVQKVTVPKVVVTVPMVPVVIQELPKIPNVISVIESPQAVKATTETIKIEGVE